LCSTVPAVLREMRRMFGSTTPTCRTWWWSRARTGVPISPTTPRRWAPTASSTRSRPTTCTAGRPSWSTGTHQLDCVSAKGEFLGGALAPGIEISLDALAQRAAQLRKVELVPPRSVIGKNTVEALQSGALYGFAGQVDNLVQLIGEEIGSPLSAVIATGGLAPIVVPESRTITVHEPDLTLVGLRLVYEKNI
jgi:type III pantothenate kinase